MTVDFEGKIDGRRFRRAAPLRTTPSLSAPARCSPSLTLPPPVSRLAETKEFSLTFPVDYGAKNLAGKIADFTLTVKKVQEPAVPGPRR